MKNTCSLAVNASPKPDRMQASFTRAGGSPRYTVRTWALWYRRVLVDESWRNEMYYMTDITPLYNMTKYWPALERLNPWLSLLRDQSSPLSLHSYLAEVCTMAIPDMDPPFYIAPVLPGDDIMIETPPHKDGHGSQSAYHLCLFGDGANRVFFWKPVLDKTAQQLHRALSIPAKPNLPHDVTGYSFSSSRDDWERKVTADGPLKEHLFKRVMLNKGEVLLLPVAFAHLFTKVVIELSSHY